MSNKGISETAFATQVEELLRRFGWERWVHIKPAIMPKGGWASRMNREGKGFLDYLCLRPPRILVIELKDNYEQLTPEQKLWWADWEACQITIVLEPLKMQGKNAGLQLGKGVKTLTIPELYLWRPKDDIEEIAEILE